MCDNVTVAWTDRSVYHRAVSYPAAMSSATVPTAADSARTARVLGPADRLLQTATDLFATQGIRSVGIDQILREAGVAKASLYSSFGSKTHSSLPISRNWISVIATGGMRRWRLSGTPSRRS